MQSLVDRHSIIPATQRPVWNALERHYQELRKLHLRDLSADDPKRGERFTAEAVGICLDYSKNRITSETLELLVRLAEESGLRGRSPSPNTLWLSRRMRRRWQSLVSTLPTCSIIPELESGTEAELRLDTSTNTLIRRYRKFRETV